jgi:glutamate 5-kinase
MRLVVKVGTSLIAPGGRIDTNRMRALVDPLDLSRHEYLIVSSGAIASGMTHLGLRQRLDAGGMRSKLRAARLASEAGASVAIANGRHAHAIPWALERNIGTYFPPQKGESSDGD